VVGATTVRAWRTAARVTTTLKDGVRDPRRRVVYIGPVLFDPTITFLVVRSPIVCGKTMNREETLNNVRSKQNIVKVKGSEKNRVTYGGDQKRGIITYNDRGRMRRDQRTKSRNITN
jgi:hypothetical protein